MGPDCCLGAGASCRPGCGVRAAHISVHFRSLIMVASSQTINPAKLYGFPN
jgi:hypothetical protein